MGFRSQVARSTLADANESRDWPGPYGDPIGDLDQSLTLWTRPPRALGQTAGQLPTRITDGKTHVNNEFLPEPGRLLRHGSGLRRFRTPLGVHPLLVVLRRANQEEHLAPTDAVGLSFERAKALSRCGGARRRDEQAAKFLADHRRDLLAVEFLSSGSRSSTAPENAVKTQIWIAVSVYVLVAIARKRLGLEASLYQILRQRYPFRENAHFTGLAAVRPPRKLTRADSIRLFSSDQPVASPASVAQSGNGQFG